MRLIMAPFAHPLFTTMSGIGVYFALQQRNGLAKAGCILLGYLGAVIMHGLWNGSSLLGIETYFGVYVLLDGADLRAGDRARRARAAAESSAIVAEKLPGMVAAGLVTPNEATWLGSIRDRKAAIGEATRLGGRPRAKRSRTSPLRWWNWRSYGTASIGASATSGWTRC